MFLLLPAAHPEQLHLLQCSVPVKVGSDEELVSWYLSLVHFAFLKGPIPKNNPPKSCTFAKVSKLWQR